MLRTKNYIKTLPKKESTNNLY